MFDNELFKALHSYECKFSWTVVIETGKSQLFLALELRRLVLKHVGTTARLSQVLNMLEKTSVSFLVHKPVYFLDLGLWA